MRWKSAFLLLSPLLGLGVVGWIGLSTGVTLRETWGLVPLPYHGLAFTAFLLSLGGRGLRLSLLAKGLGYRVGVARGATAQLVGEAAAAATPSRTGSDPARILFLRGLGVDVPAGVTILAGEIMAEGVVLTLVVGVLFLSLPDSNAVVLGAVPYGVTALFLPLLAFFSLRRPGKRRSPWLWNFLRLGERRWRGFRAGGRSFRSKARALARLEPRILVGILLASLIHLLARLSILPLLSLAVGVGWRHAPLITWPLVLLYTGSLLPPPGGGGVVEVTFIAALTPVLGETPLVGVLLWWRLYTFYLGALTGAVLAIGFLGRSGLSALNWSWKSSGIGDGPPMVPEVH